MNEFENKELQEEIEEEVKPEFVPSSKGKRALAWVLIVVVAIGIVTWLLNIAMPGWAERAGEWVRSLF